MGFFPVDHVTLQYLKLTGRSDDTVSKIESYLRANKMFVDYSEPQSESVLLLPPIRSPGPKRTHDRVPLREMKAYWQACLDSRVGFKGFAIRIGGDTMGVKTSLALGSGVVTNIHKDSPAAKYLIERGVDKPDFNSYGSRRSNDEIMAVGTFANIRIVNKLLNEEVGPKTIHIPTGEKLSVSDAALRYKSEGHDTIILAGADYGSGSSRDWAAKGPMLLDVKAVIAKSFKRIHRSNFVGMDIVPLCFKAREDADTLELTGRERYTIDHPNSVSEIRPGQDVSAVTDNGKSFTCTVRFDTEVELDYFDHESEERQISSFRAELAAQLTKLREEMKVGEIREEIKVGDTPAKKSTEGNQQTSKQKNDMISEEDLDGEILCKLVEKSDATSNWKMEERDANKHSSDPQADAPADLKMVEDIDNQTILDENELKEINKCVDLCIEDMVQNTKPLTKKFVKWSIDLDDVASPSVVTYDVADPSVTYKDQDKARVRKRIR
ncbi:hypothetical protein LWI28_018351 [Acer negundo]|uniref:Aconitase A/isopropylmalate dehydratase small subunit swivel domain-containing protein n=1 Tax=Acer negundo TaxID=4023 RepID=A0AAD5INL9_ACENE|nr:hypothetical protein LWI28_018351 [Acer negundo]